MQIQPLIFPGILRLEDRLGKLILVKRRPGLRVDLVELGINFQNAVSILVNPLRISRILPGALAN